MHTANGPPIKSTVFSLDILGVVHQLGTATLSDIVDEFDKPKSTVHDHMQTLVRLGYLFRDCGAYYLSAQFLALGQKAQERSKLFQAGRVEIEKLARTTGEHANLMVEENGRGVFLYKQKGQDSVSLDTYEGMTVALHTTAMGKAILAESSAERRDQIVDRHGLEAVTANTITDRDELCRELAEIRERGYAVDNEERITGIRCVAAPVTTDDGVAGAVSVSAPRSRMSGDRFREELPAGVLGAANVIEVNIQRI